MKQWIRIFRLARPSASGLLLSITMSMAGIGIDMVRPWPTKLIIDSALSRQPLPPAAAWLSRLPSGDKPGGLLVWLSAATIVVFVLAWANRVTNAYVQAGLGSRMTYALGGRIFERLQELSLAYHTRRSRGDLVKLVTTDSGCIRAMMLEVLLPLFTLAHDLGHHDCDHVAARQVARVARLRRRARVCLVPSPLFPADGRTKLRADAIAGANHGRGRADAYGPAGGPRFRPRRTRRRAFRSLVQAQ